MTILSRTSEYALQALIYLASRAGGPPVLAREAADYLGAPAPYLANILKSFVKLRLVTSAKGRGGGFRIRPSALDRSVLSIVEIMEGTGAYTGCVLGLKACADATACPLHYRWKPLREQMLALFRVHTLRSIGHEVRSGRYRLVLAPRPPAKPGIRLHRRRGTQP
jgi:Rrf2 family protein